MTNSKNLIDIEKSFDARFYCAWYKDLSSMEAKVAKEHWLTKGRQENRFGTFEQLLKERFGNHTRLPNDFDWAKYLILNGDLPRPPAWGEFDAKLHYIEFGCSENRFYKYEDYLKSYKVDLKDLPEDFDWKKYLALNPELKSKYVNTKILAQVHYLKFGSREGLAYAFDPEFYRFYLEKSGTHLSAKKCLEHYFLEGRKAGNPTTLKQFLIREGFSEKTHPVGFNYQQYCELNLSHGTRGKYDAVIQLMKADHVDGRPVFQGKAANFAFYKKLAIHYEVQGNADKSRKLYQSALVWGQDGQVLEHCGNIELRAGRQIAALEWYRLAMKSEGFSAFVYSNAVQILLQQNQVESAIDICREGVVKKYADASMLGALLESTFQAHWNQVAQEIKPYMSFDDRKNVESKIERMAAKQFEVWRSILQRNGFEPGKRTNLRKNSVLIVGDHFIPQCVRYRIDQKVEQLEAAGIDVETVEWTDIKGAKKSLPWHDIVIFYRVPALPEIIQLIASAHAHSKLVFYEIDDLLFDTVYPHPIDSYGGLLEINQYHDLVQGGSLMRAAAKLCTYGIASTKPLQTALADLVQSRKCFLHRNGLDSKTIQNISSKTGSVKKYTNIFYGSATKSHNSDFLTEVLPAIERVLEEHSGVKLTIVGYLELPADTLERFPDQILRMDLVNDLRAYNGYLSASDINIAVLTPDDITNCKSELKWFEAAVHGVPSVVSSTQNYLDVIQSGVDGLISSNVEEWYLNIKRLVEDPTYRHQIGENAKSRVLAEYNTLTMANNMKDIIEQASEEFLTAE